MSTRFSGQVHTVLTAAAAVQDDPSVPGPCRGVLLVKNTRHLQVKDHQDSGYSTLPPLSCNSTGQYPYAASASAWMGSSFGSVRFFCHAHLPLKEDANVLET